MLVSLVLEIVLILQTCYHLLQVQRKKNKLREKCSTTGYLKWTTSLLFHDTDAIIKTIFKNFIGELEVFINLPQNK